MAHLLPSNSTAAERAQAETLARISDVLTPLRALWNPDTCPVDLLPWLAWAYSVDQWDAGWAEAQKRATIKAATKIHRHKGTIGAIRDALAALGINLELVEWFQLEPKGDPYTFTISIDASEYGFTEDQLQQILQVVNSTKNLRSHLTGIISVLQNSGTIYTGGATCSGYNFTIGFEGTPP